MKRIDVRYDGEPYSISDRDIDELQAEIAERIAASPEGFWMRVNHGEGQPRPTFLLVTRHTPLALTPIPDQTPQ